MTNSTNYDSKVQILAETWVSHRDDSDLAEVFEYADLGFPIAYAINSKLVISTKEAQKLVDETFAALLEALEIEDSGFDDINDLVEAAGR